MAKSGPAIAAEVPPRATRWLALALLLAALPAQANVGIPLLGLYSAYSVLLLVPVVVIEALVFRNDMRAPYWRAFGASFSANLVSTIVGLVISLVTFFSGVSMLAGIGGHVVTLVMLYPFYRLSVWIENPIVQRVLRGGDKARVREAVLLANRASYLMIAIFIVVRIVKSRIVHGYFM